MTTQLSKLQADNNGKLPAYAWPGGYPIFYMTADDAVICPACANGGNGSECQNPECSGDPTWKLVAHDIHWEGEPLTCGHCNAQIDSAYGNPNE